MKLAINNQQVNLKKHNETALKQFLSLMEKIDSTNPMVNRAIKASIEECYETLQEEMNEDDVIHYIEDDETNKLIDELFETYVENIVSENIKEATERKMKLKSDQVRLKLFEEEGIEINNGELRIFHRLVEKKAENNKKKLSHAQKNKIIQWIVNLQMETKGFSIKMLSKGIFPDEINELGELESEIKEILYDFANFLNYGVQPAEMMLNAVLDDPKYALAVTEKEEIFPKPIVFLAGLRLNLLINKDIQNN